MITARPPGSATVARNTFVSGIQQVVTVGVGLLLLPVMLHWLGPERYGLLLTVQILSVAGIWSQA